MQIVPVDALPNQSLQAQLAGQPVELNIYQTAYGLFVDVYVNNDPVRLGVIAENLNRLVRAPASSFIGDFVFVDTQDSEDPVYTELGSRFLLIYLAAVDLPGAA